ncbi:Chromosome condensation complex condensin, partial [Spraguea lophii 42_110]
MILDTSVYNESNIESTANIEKDIMYRIKDIFNDISTCDIRTFNNHVDFMKRIFMKDQKRGNKLNNNGNSDGDVPSSLDFIFNVIFSYYGKNIPTKIIIFLRKIFLHKEEINNAYKSFIENNINYLLSCIESKKKRIRQRVIILLDLILTSISDKEDEGGNEDKENIFLEYIFSETDILLKVSERLFDNETIIRKEAIKLLEPYQERKINSRTKIGSIFKDLLKFDPSPEIRKLVFKTLKDFDFESNISKSTLNLLIERSKDVNPGVRRIFYTKLKNITLKEIDQEQRINILYSAYYDSKNNIDSSNIKSLVEKIITEYNLPDEFIILIEHFYNTEKLSSDNDTEIDCLKYLLELLFSALGDNILTFDETYLSNINIYSIYLMDAYLSFIEKEYSRDNLPLPSLDNYASLLYLKCKDIINTYNTENENTNTTINSIIINSSNNMYYITMLFNILKYYDFFSEENNKLILVTIYRILTQIEEIKIEKIVEESVKISIILLYNNYTPDNKLYNFLGSIIKKNNENNNKSIILSKYILKHIKYDIESRDMHEAIIKEIIQPLFQNNIFSKNILEEKINDIKI